MSGTMCGIMPLPMIHSHRAINRPLLDGRYDEVIQVMTGHNSAALEPSIESWTTVSGSDVMTDFGPD